MCKTAVVNSNLVNLPLANFHPAIQSWFEKNLGEATEPQALSWPHIQAGKHTLVSAPTGLGKTLAGFLAGIDLLVKKSQQDLLHSQIKVLYISPLKALSHDIEKNLQAPLEGIDAELNASGNMGHGIRVGVRTGDTPQQDRMQAKKHPPHIYVTTPESFYVMLTSEGGRNMLSGVEVLIVDEIHALIQNKRGAHLALSMERLEHWVKQNGVQTLQRIGLSATQKPIEEVARFLVGARLVKDNVAQCEIIHVGHKRKMDLSVQMPNAPLEAVMSNEVWGDIYDKMQSQIEAHKTTLVFVNTRRSSERISKALEERLGSDVVMAHHGSLSRETRLLAEQKLKSGELRVLVATASLELGIDVGHVDLVIQVGSPRSIATFLQRVGRSGHHKLGLPKGILYPSTRDDLLETAALLYGIEQGMLEQCKVYDAPIDVLSQQLIAMIAANDVPWNKDELYQTITQAWPYRRLEKKTFDEVITMLVEGFTTHRGRRAAHLFYDSVSNTLKPRRGARLYAITCGGTIPEMGEYTVIAEPDGIKVGTVHEDFAVESMAGDIFQLGNTSWKIIRVMPGKMHVQDAKGQTPTIPFWLGEAPGRSDALSLAVSEYLKRAEHVLVLHDAQAREQALSTWIASQMMGGDTAAQLAGYLHLGFCTLGVLPRQDHLVAERFFDEAGNMHLVIHTRMGARTNRAFGLSLRKRFCASFNFELQAAANDDAVILSLGPTHSFGVEEPFSYLRSNTVRDVLIQAMLDAPIWGVRWRWAATIALAIPRMRGGKKTGAPLLRMMSEDLLAVVFPDAQACLENVVGKREVPNHPLVNQAITDCLEEAMDLPQLEAMLLGIHEGRIKTLGKDLTEPSVFAAEILNAKPYAFLDDAPLEERRTQAVLMRRTIDPKDASELGRLDPAAITAVCQETWPLIRDKDELQDALGIVGFFTAKEAEPHKEWMQQLLQEGRAIKKDKNCFVIERKGDGIKELLRSRMGSVGPKTEQELAADFGCSPSDIILELLALQQEGLVLKGKYREHVKEDEWCDRRILARIHRRTLETLRKEIEPCTLGEFKTFLFSWQHAEPDKMRGMEGLLHVIEQLEGFPIAAGAWERDIFPRRIEEYDPKWLDALCYSGQVVWHRAITSNINTAQDTIRTTPIYFSLRKNKDVWSVQHKDEAEISGEAEVVRNILEQKGAMFFDDLLKHAAMPRAFLERALRVLVARGVVVSDSFSGLRSLLSGGDSTYRSSWMKPKPFTNAGRWSLVDRIPTEQPLDRETQDMKVQFIAKKLLSRWGIVSRKMIEAERLPRPGLEVKWRELLVCFRRMEARGEIRGGRFVTVFVGEQYALPEAVTLLREIRRKKETRVLPPVFASDPLSIVG